MKVLHITNAYPTVNNPIYGVFIKEQIESLKKIDGLIPDVYFINAREKGKLEYIRSLIFLRKKVREYDIIHCHHVFSALVVLMVRSKKNRIIVSFLSQGSNELNFRFKIPFSSELYKFVLQNTDARIFKFGIPDDLKGDDKSYYIPNGVNMDLFKPMGKQEAKRILGLDPGKKYILFVSSNYLERPEKRYDRFLTTLELLKSRHNMTNVEPLFLIKEERERVPLYFNSADLHLLTSDVEGSPNSVKESLSCNTPVVSTNVGNVIDLLDNIKNCYISYGRTPEELAEYCYLVLNNTEGINLRERINKLGLDMESVANRINLVYTSVCQVR